MYIVTLEAYDREYEQYDLTFRDFSTIEEAKEFVADVYEDWEARNVHFWDAKELEVDIDELLN